MIEKSCTFFTRSFFAVFLRRSKQFSTLLFSLLNSPNGNKKIFCSEVGLSHGNCNKASRRPRNGRLTFQKEKNKTEKSSYLLVLTVRCWGAVDTEIHCLSAGWLLSKNSALRGDSTLLLGLLSELEGGEEIRLVSSFTASAELLSHSVTSSKVSIVWDLMLTFPLIH